MGLLRLFRRAPLERQGFQLYTAAVGAARHPAFFARIGVADSLDGRFDLVGLHVALLIRRLRQEADPRGGQLAQAVFDAMFADMDHNLREMGVGDMSIARRVKAMWEAFHGRAKAYDASLDAGDAAALSEALLRNVWRGSLPTDGSGPARLAQFVLRTETELTQQSFEDLLRGKITFYPPEDLP
ncbi:ubiquinol-cytochrome C chaperone family protein [Pseudoroseomonas globiformis]|uniref:Ubiquinol-cytochrome C chaperone family protein n=1 Tax=Teichococcus globiformis TaxID=2307229 RepID=A0ABV7FZV6_9PROT